MVQPRLRAVALAWAAAFGLVTLSSTPAHAVGTPRDLGVIGEEDVVDASAFQREHERRLDEARPVSERKFRYQRTGNCLAPAGSQHLCPPPVPPGLVCEDGPPLAPLWRQALEGDNQWYRLGNWVCPEDLQPPFTEADLRRLKVKPVRVRHQPASGPMLITKPVIVYAEPKEQRFDVRLLDFYDVEVVVTPAEYTWDFGDGATLTSTEPGRPYPAFDLTHVYDELGQAQITLRTAWTAMYRVATDPAGRWRDAEGSVETAHEGEPFEVIELRSKLDG